MIDAWASQDRCLNCDWENDRIKRMCYPCVVHEIQTGRMERPKRQPCTHGKNRICGNCPCHHGEHCFGLGLNCGPAGALTKKALSLGGFNA